MILAGRVGVCLLGWRLTAGVFGVQLFSCAEWMFDGNAAPSEQAERPPGVQCMPGPGSVYACSPHMRHVRERFDKPIALIDMDGNWLQWGVRLNEILLRLDPSFPIVDDDDKRSGWDDLAGPGGDPMLLKEAMNHPDLYNDIEPVPYSVESILEMADEGFDVFHCSTPTWTNPGCVPGKLAAIDQYFGPKAVDRLILTHDKTMVTGDVLIDDKRHHHRRRGAVLEAPDSRPVPQPVRGRGAEDERLAGMAGPRLPAAGPRPRLTCHLERVALASAVRPFLASPAVTPWFTEASEKRGRPCQQKHSCGSAQALLFWSPAPWHSSSQKVSTTKSLRPRPS
ncbi:hypothetical protein DQ354_18105 [Arthrobacter sp. AQ5-06]|nr:hypothetical protein DQ354_18105 [Arthrobacter sp. AQ5-06]